MEALRHNPQSPAGNSAFAPSGWGFFHPAVFICDAAEWRIEAGSVTRLTPALALLMLLHVVSHVAQGRAPGNVKLRLKNVAVIFP